MITFEFVSQCWKTGESNSGAVQAQSMARAMKKIRKGNRFLVIKSCVARWRCLSGLYSVWFDLIQSRKPSSFMILNSISPSHRSPNPETFYQFDNPAGTLDFRWTLQGYSSGEFFSVKSSGLHIQAWSYDSWSSKRGTIHPSSSSRNWSIYFRWD